MSKKKFLAIKYCLTALLLVCFAGVQAQSATYKNTTGVSGKPSLHGSQVNDISFTTFRFPAIGLALSASTPDLQNDGSYNITYTYTIKNMGGLDLTKVNVTSSFSSTFPSPMTYTITSVTGQGITTNSAFKGTDALSLLSNTNATLAAGATATITVVLNLKNGGQYGTFTTQPDVTALAGTAVVSDKAVDGTEPDANGNGSAFDDESPTPVTLTRPDIAVNKTVNTNSPYVGDAVTFTITVTNNGTGDAANVILAEALGDGFTYLSTSVGSAYNSTTNNWSIGILKSGQAKTMTLTARIKMSGNYTNTASSNHPEDIVLTNNSASVTLIPLPSADVQIVKTASKDSVDVNEVVTYTLTAGNNGPSHATNVVVTDQLPTGIVPALPLAAGLDYDEATRTITWNLGNVNAGTTGLVKTFNATISEDVGRAVFSNTATIAAQEHDPATGNNSSTVNVVPKQFVDLVVTKSIVAPSPLYPLDKVTFTVTVQNIGANNCYDVNVTDVLQSGYKDGKPTPSKGTFSNNSWKINQLNKGETATLTYEATVQPKGDYNNKAVAYTTDNDIDLTNNTGTIVPPVVTPRMDLAVDITTTGTPLAGQTLTFTITANNDGPSDATGVIIENVKLPAGYTLTQNTPGAGTSYDPSTGTLTIGNLIAGGSTTLVLKGTVKPDETNYTLNAHIKGNEVEVTMANNDASVTPAIKQATDLKVTKNVDPTTPDAGTHVTFTITAENTGPSKATGVQVKDALPTGYTFVSTSSTNYDGAVWNVGALNVNEKATLTVTVKVNPTGNYQNTAIISGAEVDNNKTNDTARSTTAPIAVSDVKVSKTISNTTPDVGSTVTFNITATNDGPSTAQNVTVKDVLQNGYTFAVTPAPTKGTFNTSTGVWTIGSMASGSTVTLPLIVKVLGKGTSYGNTVTISTTTKDTNPDNNTFTITPPTVRPVADLQIEKTVDKATADAGAEVIFTLKATNKGASPATNVKVTDQLPDGFTFKSMLPSNAAYISGSGEWTIGSLDSGAVKTLAITATVNATGDYTNTATIAGTEYDPVITNDTSRVTVTRVAVADLEVTKSASNMTPDAGDYVTFTIVATNHGPSKATNVVVKDPAPSGYGDINYDPSIGTVDADGNWTIGNMNKDATATLTVTAKVLASGDYQNTVTISGTEVDRNTTNNTASVTPVPVPVADVVITKTISNDKPDVGSTVTFTITAKNDGPSTATGVTVTDKLTSGYDFKLKTPSTGTYDETTGIWTIGSMTNGQTETLTIEAEVLPTGDYNNTATIASPVKDNHTGNNTASITTPQVRAITDLAIIKTADKTTADAGSEVVFTLAATNNGPSVATNVIVKDRLPDGYTFESIQPTTADYDATTGNWTIGTMNKGATQTLTITATVNATGDYTNTATIAGTEYDPVITNDTSRVTVTRVAVADLEVTKAAGNMTPDAGDNITFTIVATNHGPSKATNVVVKDPAPSGYGSIAYNPSIGTVDTDGNWTIGDMNKNATATLTVTAKVLASGDYQNTATIAGTEVDRNTTNDTSSITPVPVPVADLVVTKTISNDKPDVGSTVTFTITAKNEGPSTATGVTVTDKLTSGYDFKLKTPSTGTYDETTGVWTIGSMSNGQTETLTIEAEVLPTGDYNNTATITSPVKDNHTGNNTATITTPQVRPVADLVIAKTVDKTTADAGSKVVFTLVATNNGPSAATHVIVKDRLPDGYTFESIQPTAANYDAATGNWTIGTMNKGATQTLAITATVNATGDYTNTATITGTEHDPVTTNNTSSANATRIAVSDLEVTKSADNMTPDAGTNVTFTIQARNYGPSTATNVVVTDLLPSGYELVQDIPTTGTFTSDGKWTIGNMNINTSATLVITAKVLATGNYTNTAAITGIETDHNLSNNSSSVTPVPVPVTNLQVVKTIDHPTPDVSSQVIFTITAKNEGPSAATGVTVTDILQSGYHFEDATTATGAYDASTGKWNIGNLANGQSATLQIKATVLPEGDYSNVAVISGNEKDKTPTDNESAITTPVPVAVADLQVIKTIDKTVPGTGDKVTFTITVKNNGASKATQVRVTDQLESGFTYQQATTAKGSYDPATGIWTIGNMNANETVVLLVDALVNTTGHYTNTATVTAAEKDPATANNTSTVAVTPDPIVDLHINKTISNTAPPHGSDVTFTISIGNDGPSDATGVTVTDILPDGYTYKSANTSTGSYNAVTGSWTIGGLASQATAEMTMVVTVNKTGSYANTATITGHETDRVSSNNSSTVTPVPVPLSTKDDAASTEEPDPVVIDVIKNDTYGNTGHTVYIKDLPQHGTVKDNGDGTVTYTPQAGFGGTDQFTYYIQDQSGFASNVSTVTIDVTKRQVDLSIKKVIITPPAEIAVGKNVTFELSVTNNSRKGASNIVVTDMLASNVGDMQIKTNAENGKEGYDPLTKTLSWKLDTLAPGQTIKLTLSAKLLSGGVVNNTASVTGENADPDPTNNTATVSSEAKGPDIFIPTAFTPNGDGINDKFIILGIDRYPGSVLIVFNRWGNVVYRSNDYRNNWDGSNLNEGTYYYELVCPTTTNGKISLKGWVQLVR